MANKQTHTIAVIAGDGIGKEVIPAGMAAIEKAARGSAGRRVVHRAAVGLRVLPAASADARRGRLRSPGDVRRHLPRRAWRARRLGRRLAGLILAIRQRFDQYVNLRPMRLLPGLSSPLANRGAADIDMVCVRENSEGEYSGVGGRIHRGTPHEVAQQTGVFTRHGIERILRYAFELAATRPRKMLASATKSNALTALDGACGTRSPRSCGRTTPASSTGSTTSMRSRRAWSRIRRRSTCWSPRTCSATS